VEFSAKGMLSGREKTDQAEQAQWKRQPLLIALLFRGPYRTNVELFFGRFKAVSEASCLKFKLVNRVC
jgi:hypothetical protein